MGDAKLRPAKTIEEISGDEELTDEEVASILRHERSRRGLESVEEEEERKGSANPMLFHCCSRTRHKIGTKYFSAPEIVRRFINTEHTT